MPFEEEQQFRQRWIWALMGFILLVHLLAVAHQATALANPAGEDVPDRPIMLMILVGTLVSGTLFPVMFWKLKLRTRVDASGIDVGFQIWRTHLDYKDIAAAQRRQYKPLREYGGWGVRWSFRHGQAYNVSGAQGVQLILRSGKKLLIGSQRPAELERAIRHYLGQT